MKTLCPLDILVVTKRTVERSERGWLRTSTWGTKRARIACS